MVSHLMKWSQVGLLTILIGPCLSIQMKFPNVRPKYHLTPEGGGLNDPNGLFKYKGVYHVFHQFHPPQPPVEWYHQTSRDLVTWTRQPLPQIPCISGGAVIDPAGVPTIFVCPNETSVHIARPSNLSDPYLKSWTISATNIVEGTYKPPSVPGYWDVSGYFGYDGLYHMVVGSCNKSSGTGGYCDGGKTTGNPEVMTLVTKDFKTWKYVGQVWRGSNVTYGPRTECPQMMDRGLVSKDSGLVGLLVSFPYWFQNTVIIGKLENNGSSFKTVGPPEGHILDYGGILYAGQTMYDEDNDRRLYWGWIAGNKNCGPMCANASWGGCALSLPRVLRVNDRGDLTWDIAPEIENLRITPAIFSETNLKLESMSKLQVDLKESNGDSLEILLNLMKRDIGSLSVLVRASPDLSEMTTIEFDPLLGLTVCTTSVFQPTPDRLPSQPSCARAPAMIPVPNSSSSVANIRIFIDASIVEVHVNSRISVTLRVFPSRLDSREVFIVNKASNPIDLNEARIWEMNGCY